MFRCKESMLDLDLFRICFEPTRAFPEEVCSVIVAVFKVGKEMALPTFGANNGSHQTPLLLWVAAPGARVTLGIILENHLSQPQTNPLDV